jgi:hypothetical protein
VSAAGAAAAAAFFFLINFIWKRPQQQEQPRSL